MRHGRWHSMAFLRNSQCFLASISRQSTHTIAELAQRTCPHPLQESGALNGSEHVHIEVGERALGSGALGQCSRRDGTGHVEWHVDVQQ